ncbi:heterokaryon incompatibility protein-domain-containing protein, partial [Microdochium bolleyi]
YLALSYRWGNAVRSSLMLTARTESEMRSGMPTSALPRTIQDACTVVKRLGYRYLWVDRLCIFQDSGKDWNHESGRMGHIYKHAKLVIAASCAAEENMGFFRDRHEQALEYELGYLSDRGWTFQERVLPARIVHFAGDQVHWECARLDAWPHAASWSRLVTEYSERRFTFESDKLSALSGLAREWRSLRARRGVPEDAYYAGLWGSSFMFGLCWLPLSYTVRQRDSPYIAPSWSW